MSAQGLEYEDKFKRSDMVDLIMAYEQGNLDDRGTLELFAALIGNGMVWQLQGCYGRQAKRLIDAGWLDREGNILKEIEE